MVSIGRELPCPALLRLTDIKNSLYALSVTLMLPIADLFQALADPTRLRIVALLRAMELSVGELAQVLEQSQPRVSRHVKILGDAGIVERRKEGSWVFLTLADPERSRPLMAHDRPLDRSRQRTGARR